MRVFIAYRSGQAEARASGFPNTHDPLRDFIKGLLQSTWQAIEVERVRAALEHAARYVNVKLSD
jgi:hypothetical protein